MNEKPRDIQELLRLAIRAQMDIGLDQVVLNDRPADGLDIARSAEQAHGRRVSVADAVQEQQPGGAALGEPTFGRPPLDDPEFESLDAHNTAICECLKCPLGKTRTKFVYGVGNPNADLMFIGEAPGADEDRQGEPFVGRAGQLLDKIIAAMKMSRQDVYIANILKCRPPGNRDPQPDEVKSCMPYLREQIRLIRPKVLCLLGRIAAHAILDTTSPLGRLRGQWHTFETIPTLVTYHPAALLRFTEYKRPTWEDMQLVMQKLEESK